ncbi:MAG: chemotaxis protein CheW [Granulosicoccus sp.]
MSGSNGAQAQMVDESSFSAVNSSFNPIRPKSTTVPVANTIPAADPVDTTEGTDTTPTAITSDAANAANFETVDETPKSLETSIYGSFSIGTSEFALPVSVVQQVVNEPENYSSVPLSPDFLLGLFNLRGNVIPVVDLSRIFKLESQAKSEDTDGTVYTTRKVAILEHGNLCLGLLFDSTGEVFNENEVETCLFENHRTTIQDQVIAGVFKMDGGSRIVQLLDVAGMLQLDRIPQSTHQGEISSSTRRRGKRQQCISFEVGNSCCALDIGAIKEIVNIGCIENTVLAGSLCLGAIDIRGNTVPIVNFSLLLGYSDSSNHEIHESDSHRVIIMKVGDNLFGLLVNRINNIVSFFEDELIPFPVLGDHKTAMFKGCVSLEAQDLETILLEQSEIFSNEEIQAITKGHSALFKDARELSYTEKQGSLNRKTLITFSLDNRYGLDISDVKEVIDYPTDLIKTPTITTHIRGMANLRGELVAIIDTRVLYDLEPFSDHGNTKVLVFEVANVKYGLMVDSVDSIVPFRESDSIEIPHMVFSEKDGVIDKDVKEAIMIKTGTEHQTVCVLNLESVSSRASSD